MIWTVTLTDGVYHYQCDAHPSILHGDFAVGSATLPTTTTTTTTTTTKPMPKMIRLAAGVGPGARIGLTRAGARVRTVPAGMAVIVVSDRSAKDNFRLVGPGVNKATSKRGRSTVTWMVTLRRGLYTFRSDATPALKGSFRAA